MSRNYSELQYLRVLRRIVIENAKPEFKETVEKYQLGELSIVETYNQLLEAGDNDLRNILDNYSNDRTGTGTYKVFGDVMKFDLTQGFPLLTTKKIFTRGILEELFWFISGSTNIRPLIFKNVDIWNPDALKAYLRLSEPTNKIKLHSDEWNDKMNWFITNIKEDEEFANKWGNLGPVYGAQWRNFGGHDQFKMSIENNLNDMEFRNKFEQLCNDYHLSWGGSKGVDQLKEVIEKLKTNPNDRRMLVFSYNPNEVKDQVLPACHAFFQLYTKNNELSCMMYQRSCDMFLGLPFNIASYAALTCMIAHVTGLKAKEFIHILGDAHIYSNHVEQIQLQLTKDPYPMPTLWLDPSVKNIEEFNIDKVKIKNYKCHEKISGEVSV